MASRSSLALVALLVIMLIMTAAVAGKAPHVSALGDITPFILPAILTFSFLVVLAYGKVIVAMLAALLLKRPKRDERKMGFLATLLGYLIVAIALILLVRTGGIQRFLTLFDQTATLIQSSGAQTLLTNQGIQSAPSALTTLLSYYTALIFAGIILLYVIFFFAALRLAFRQNHPPFSGEQTKREALQVVQQAVKSLTNKAEYEETILRCYRQMCDVLRGRGFVIAPAETAREFASTVSQKLSLGSDAVEGLTFLFEEARYSAHIITDDKRRLAVNELSSIENALSKGAS
jgi:hypothetical protein